MNRYKSQTPVYTGVCRLTWELENGVDIEFLGSFTCMSEVFRARMRLVESPI